MRSWTVRSLQSICGYWAKRMRRKSSAAVALSFLFKPPFCFSFAVNRVIFCSSFLWSYTWISYWIGFPVAATSFHFSVPQTCSIGKEQQINWIAYKNEDNKENKRSLYWSVKSYWRSMHPSADYFQICILCLHAYECT